MLNLSRDSEEYNFSMCKKNASNNLLEMKQNEIFGGRGRETV